MIDCAACNVKQLQMSLGKLKVNFGVVLLFMKGGLRKGIEERREESAKRNSAMVLGCT